MSTSGLVLWGFATATAFALAAGGCGGSIAPAIGGDGGSSSGGTGSSSGTSSGASSGASSSGIVSSSSGGGSGSGGSSSGVVSSSGSGSGSGSGGSSSGVIGSSSGPNGSINFEECLGGSSTLCGAQQFAFYASFTTASSQTPGCTVTTSNGCALYDCQSTSTSQSVSAGTLTISGGSIGTPIPVTPDSTENYQYQTAAMLFSPGQTLTVSATGATVPKFGPISVLAPATTSMLLPKAPYAVSLKADLQVQWSGAAAGSEFVLEGISAVQTYFLCQWDAATGKSTVPASIIAGIGPGSGYLIYGQYSSTTITTGGFAIYDSALSYGGDTATFQ
jgi:hypothetical protein